MTNPEITVYCNPLSPYVNKVRAILNLKGLDYEVRYVDPRKQKEALAFAGWTKVPVVTVGDKILVDSTPIALALDELFPSHRRLLPEESSVRRKLLDLDNWVSHELISTGFYTSQHLPLPAKLLNGWRSGVIHSETLPARFPLWLRLMWPLFVVRASFVAPIIENIVTGTPVDTVRRRVCEDFIERLEGGPFLGAQPEPTLPDCAAYGHFIPCYMGGMVGYNEFLEYPEIREWVQRMTPLVYSPGPFWPDKLVRRKPEAIRAER